MAMTTAGDIIRAALGKILVLGTQDTLADADMQTGLDALNMMLDSWQNQSLAVYAVQQYAANALVAGTASYTVGSGGTFNVARPVRILKAFTRYQGVDYAMTCVDRYQYDDIPVKTVQGIPQILFYDRLYPLGTVYVYPVPYPSGMTLYFDGYLPIESFTDTADAFSLPPGYVRALVYNLALELAPDYNKDAGPDVRKIAAESLGTLKRNNQQDVLMKYDVALLAPTGAYNVYSDSYW